MGVATRSGSGGRPDTTSHAGADAAIKLLGGFQLQVGGHVQELPIGVAKLLAFLAIQARPVSRTYAANCLWLDKSECRALANLRSCLWRLRHCSAGLVVVTPTHVALGAAVEVDLAEVRAVAGRLMCGSELDVLAVNPMLFCSELLPTWYDDFVEMEREHLRQARLYALEAMAAEFLRLGHNYRAINLALTAVGCDPLRESGHRLVIDVHLADGNVSEALRHYQLLRSILRRELGIEPSPAATRLVAAWL